MKTREEMQMDNYEEFFGCTDEDEFLTTIREIDNASEWIPDVKVSKEIRVSPISIPLGISNLASEKNIDPDLLYDTARANGEDKGTSLIYDRIFNGEVIESVPIRDTAFSTLCETAKLNGTALKLMNPDKLAQTLNNGLEVAKSGSSAMCLKRYGKICAFHSGADGGYVPMPISQLVNSMKDKVTSRFGEMLFTEGSVNHSSTTAVYELPDASSDLVSAYQKALEEAAPGRLSVHGMNFSAALYFTSSDTAFSSARVIPMFTDGSCEVRLTDGISVKHKKFKDGALAGCEKFDAELEELYAKFNAGIVKAATLAAITVNYPVNAVVSICKRYAIAQCWGSYAVEKVEQYLRLVPALTAHDIYIIMCEMVGYAKAEGASTKTLNNISESVAKILVLNWKEHDVAGTVSW